MAKVSEKIHEKSEAERATILAQLAGKMFAEWQEKKDEKRPGFSLSGMRLPGQDRWDDEVNGTVVRHWEGAVKHELGVLGGLLLLKNIVRNFTEFSAKTVLNMPPGAQRILGKSELQFQAYWADWLTGSRQFESDLLTACARCLGNPWEETGWHYWQGPPSRQKQEEKSERGTLKGQAQHCARVTFLSILEPLEIKEQIRAAKMIWTEIVEPFVDTLIEKIGEKATHGNTSFRYQLWIAQEKLTRNTFVELSRFKGGEEYVANDLAKELAEDLGAGIPNHIAEKMRADFRNAALGLKKASEEFQKGIEEFGESVAQFARQLEKQNDKK